MSLITLSKVHARNTTDNACCRWINQRKAFGKPLHTLAVIRSKMAEMISRTEAVQNWLENITFQMCNMVRLSSLHGIPHSDEKGR